MKPSKEAIGRRLRMICGHQGLQVDKATIDQVVESSGNDIRQIINILQMWNNHQMDSGFLKKISKDESVMISNFDAALRLLDHGRKNLNVNYPEFRHKMDLFFIDYDMIPNIMQENYLNAMGDVRDMRSIEAMAEAADYISMGD
jgi:replication factor C subunit 1